MDPKLNFLTKELVEKAAEEIEKKGIPKKREGKEYSVIINEKEFPFKLLITEAAKLANIELESGDFGSNEINRAGFEKITGYECIKINMDYFNLDQIFSYSKDVGKKYDEKSEGAKCYYDTREKLQYLGRELGKELSVSLTNNYNEKPNKMAGQGKGFVLKEYILAGFLPSKYAREKDIFIKLCFFDFGTKLQFGIDVDVNFSDKKNPYNSIRNKIQDETTWAIAVDKSFPKNWDDLINIVKPIFQKQIEYVESFFSNKEKNIVMEKYANILKQKYQIILQGPPGTGKTYTAKDIAEYMIFESVNVDKTEQKKMLDDSGQFELIQFHPAYTYEDFVRGITAKSNDGQIEYITENKVIAEFADKANKNYFASKKDAAEFTKEQRVEKLIIDFADKIQDEIDKNDEYKITSSVSIIAVEEDAFRYSGKWKVSQRMKFIDLIKAELNGVNSRKEMKAVHNISGLAKHHASYFIKVLNIFQKEYKEQLSKAEQELIPTPKLKNYVIVIDEINRANLPSVLGELIYALEYRGESVKSMYAIDGDASIVIPNNLYIIGTMNTADRSVGHIDYAIRRRFAFESLLPDQDIIETDKGKEYFSLVENLFSNDNLSQDFKNRKEDVQIGHSYFMGKEENLLIKMKYEVIPILKEYLKDGIFKEEAREKIELLEKQISL